MRVLVVLISLAFCYCCRSSWKSLVGKKNDASFICNQSRSNRQRCSSGAFHVLELRKPADLCGMWDTEEEDEILAMLVHRNSEDGLARRNGVSENLFRSTLRSWSWKKWINVRIYGQLKLTNETRANFAQMITSPSLIESLNSGRSNSPRTSASKRRKNVV